MNLGTTGMGTTFIQEIGLALLTILTNATQTTISFIFSLISSLVSALLYQNGLGTSGLFGS